MREVRLVPQGRARSCMNVWPSGGRAAMHFRFPFFSPALGLRADNGCWTAGGRSEALAVGFPLCSTQEGFGRRHEEKRITHHKTVEQTDPKNADGKPPPHPNTIPPRKGHTPRSDLLHLSKGVEALGDEVGRTFGRVHFLRKRRHQGR